MILYYSKSGTTEKLATRIQADLGCNLLKVEPENPYGNYISAVIRFLWESAKGVTPKTRTAVPNLKVHDIVLIGYPLWGGDIPPFFKAFLQSTDLSGKAIIPFATSGGVGIEKSVGTLRSICPNSKIIHPLHVGRMKQDNYDDWLSIVKKSE
jgi:flavodoxin